MALVNRMTARIDNITSARFRVVSEYYGGDVRGANIRQVVLVRAPSDLHVQILSPFGQTLQTLVANSDTLSWYDAENAMFYRGTPSPENIARLLPFHLTAADIVRVLLGGPPVDQMGYDPANYTLDWDRTAGRYHLVTPLASGDGHLELGVAHGDWTIVSAKRIDSAGEAVFELRTGDIASRGGFRIPTRLRLLITGDSPVDMSMEVESVEFDVPLPDTLFALEPPQGIDVLALD